RQALEILGRVSAQLCRICQQQQPHISPSFMQLARNYKSVAAIVALTADYAKTSGGWIRRQSKLRHRRSRVFHQRERRDTKSLASHAVDLAHFCSRDNFHLEPSAIRLNLG